MHTWVNVCVQQGPDGAGTDVLLQGPGSPKPHPPKNTLPLPSPLR
jgi:hypothetical protein